MHRLYCEKVLITMLKSIRKGVKKINFNSQGYV